MKRSILRLAMLPVALLLFFVLLIGPGLLTAPITLLIGWWSSAARLIKRWQPSSASLVLFLLAAILLVAGTHRFLNWIFAARRTSEGSGPIAWRWKWTICGFGVITCTLLAICAMVLTTHQVYWISKSSDPLFNDPFRDKMRALRLTMDLQKRAEESNWDTAKTRAFFQQDDFNGSGQSAAEAIQSVWIERDERSLRAIILIPRHPLNRTTAKLTVLQPGTNSTNHRLEELPQVLASFNSGSSAQLSAGADPPPR